MSTWIRRSSVVLLKPALAHSMTSHFHPLIIPLNSSDTNSSSDIKSKMHLCENECEHGTFHLIWVFREHHIHYLLFAIFLDCGVDEMYNSWAVSSLANLASDERCFAKFPFLLLQRNRLHLTRSKQYNGIVVKAKSTWTISFFRPYVLYCFNSREIQINLIESLQGLQEYKIAFEGSQNAFYKWLHCNIFGLQNWGGALNIISHQFHQIISSSVLEIWTIIRKRKCVSKQ